jgi:5-methyltetrahydrofolate--homocysteine methyltransferase
MAGLSEIRQSIIDGDPGRAEELTLAALEGEVTAVEILHEGLVPAMGTVGELFEKREFFFPELLLAGEAMKASLRHLKTILSKSEVAYAGTFAIGTVQDDIHDIGKNIVIMMLEANGWEVTDLGIGVSSDKFCQAVKEGKHDILGMSSLLTLTMPNLKKTIDALKEAGLREKVKIIIGGTPVTQDYADQIGADAYAYDAVQAVLKARTLANKT